jgi:hypothetical protein
MLDLPTFGLPTSVTMPNLKLSVTIYLNGGYAVIFALLLALHSFDLGLFHFSPTGHLQHGS